MRHIGAANGYFSTGGLIDLNGYRKGLIRPTELEIVQVLGDSDAGYTFLDTKLGDAIMAISMARVTTVVPNVLWGNDIANTSPLNTPPSTSALKAKMEVGMMYPGSAADQLTYAYALPSGTAPCNLVAQMRGIDLLGTRYVSDWQLDETGSNFDMDTTVYTNNQLPGWLFVFICRADSGNDLTAGGTQSHGFTYAGGVSNGTSAIDLWYGRITSGSSYSGFNFSFSGSGSYQSAIGAMLYYPDP